MTDPFWDVIVVQNLFSSSEVEFKPLRSVSTNQRWVTVDQLLSSEGPNSCLQILLSFCLNKSDVKPFDPYSTGAPRCPNTGLRVCRNLFFCSHEGDILLTSRTVILDAC